MKIKPDKQIEDYIKRCYSNLDLNYQNDFLDGYVEPENEEEAKKELLQAGQQEFLYGNPSLYIHTADFRNNPYYKNIHLDKIVSSSFSYEKVLIEKNLLFNYDSIIDDEEKELKDYMKLRALDEDLEMIYLFEENEGWMMCSPSEASTNDPYAAKARGNVLTFGLGIGYFVYMAILNPNVDSVTVIEKSEDVIALFSQIVKQFPQNKEIRIIQGDAFDYFNDDFLKKFDYAYVDFWESSEDGLKSYMKLMEKNITYKNIDYWIEDSILTNIQYVMAPYLYAVYSGQSITDFISSIDFDSKDIVKKVNRYFKSRNNTITFEDELLDIIHNKNILRKIAGQV